MMKRNSSVFAGVIFAFVLSGNLVAADLRLPAALEKIREHYDFPALAGAIVTIDGVGDEATVGMRKRGTTIAATDADLWSLGSDTKALTAVLVGTFVAEGKLNWSTPVASFFPEVAARIPAANRAITVGDVLSHSAGLRDGYARWYALARHGSVMEQRQAVAREALLGPEFPPGTFHYANNDYILIAALLERLTGRSWEQLMTERVFKPLHMNSAGFYRAAKPGKVDEPWPHDGNGRPISPTDFAMLVHPVIGTIELPPLAAPAGLIHCSLADWAKFLRDQLRGGAGLPALLPATTYEAMQTARPNSPYGYGWGVGSLAWAGGKILNHDGSDQLNYCTCWLALPKKFGVVVCANQGGPNAETACRDAAAVLISKYLKAEQDPAAALITPPAYLNGN